MNQTKAPAIKDLLAAINEQDKRQAGVRVVVLRTTPPDIGKSVASREPIRQDILIRLARVLGLAPIQVTRAWRVHYRLLRDHENLVWYDYGLVPLTLRVANP